MTVIINGPTPTVDLQMRNYSDEMTELDVLSWTTLESAFTTVAGGRITAVAPRAGTHGLDKTADSAGPLAAKSIGLEGGKMTAGTACQLQCLAPLSIAEFSIAMIWNIGTYSAATQDIMSLHFNQNALRVWQNNGRAQMRLGSGDVVLNPTQITTPGPVLTIMSTSAGNARLLHRSLAVPGVVTTTAWTPVAATSPRAVFGGDKSPTPTIARVMRDTVFDTFVFDRDMLVGNDPALTLISKYFGAIYAQ